MDSSLEKQQNHLKRLNFIRWKTRKTADIKPFRNGNREFRTGLDLRLSFGAISKSVKKIVVIVESFYNLGYLRENVAINHLTKKVLNLLTKNLKS